MVQGHKEGRVAGAEKARGREVQQKMEGLTELHESGTKETGKTSLFLFPSMSRKQNPGQREKSW